MPCNKGNKGRAVRAGLCWLSMRAWVSNWRISRSLRSRARASCAGLLPALIILGRHGVLAVDAQHREGRRSSWAASLVNCFSRSRVSARACISRLISHQRRQLLGLDGEIEGLRLAG